jgi:hypothetical protein
MSASPGPEFSTVFLQEHFSLFLAQSLRDAGALDLKEMFLQQRFFIVRSIVVSLCSFIESVPAATQARASCAKCSRRNIRHVLHTIYPRAQLFFIAFEM